MRRYPTNPFQIAIRPPFCSAAFGPLKYSSTAAPTGLIDERISRDVAFSNGAVPFASNCLSVNTILILTVGGVGVDVGVSVFVEVGVCEGVTVADAVNVGVIVREGVDDIVRVAEGLDEGVAVFDGVKLGVYDIVAVGAGVIVLVGVRDGVREGVAVDV
jgi:hypothetical protein